LKVRETKDILLVERGPMALEIDRRDLTNRVCVREVWELDSWITPTAKFFRVAHYQGPAGLLIDDNAWKLEVTGLVNRPLTLTASNLQAHREPR
jgi:DMSO/TMAO reductase YedYZ molybdopterin-dependent catalytic subunit